MILTLLETSGIFGGLPGIGNPALWSLIKYFCTRLQTCFVVRLPEKMQLVIFKYIVPTEENVSQKQKRCNGLTQENSIKKTLIRKMTQEGNLNLHLRQQSYPEPE